jgi:hypothetical protein
MLGLFGISYTVRALRPIQAVMRRLYRRPVYRGRAGSMNVVSFVSIVAGTAISTSGANMADIAIRFRDLTVLSRDQKKLFPHFG